MCVVVVPSSSRTGSCPYLFYTTSKLFSHLWCTLLTSRACKSCFLPRIHGDGALAEIIAPLSRCNATEPIAIKPKYLKTVQGGLDSFESQLELNLNPCTDRSRLPLRRLPHRVTYLVQSKPTACSHHRTRCERSIDGVISTGFISLFPRSCGTSTPMVSPHHTTLGEATASTARSSLEV